MPKLLPDYKEFSIHEGLQPFSKIRLVALDLDGTLLSSNDEQLPRKVLELARKLDNHKHDVRLTIATGRTLNGTRKLLEMLPIRKDTPIILYNGNVIINSDYEVLYRNTLTLETFQQVLQLSNKFKVKVMAYSYEWFKNDEPKEYAFGWSAYDRTELDYNKMPISWCEWKDSIYECSPSAIVIHTQGDYHTTQALSEGLDAISGICYTHGRTYIEVGPVNSNKGKALEFSARCLKFTADQVLAIGDNDNDAEMLSWAGIGVAVDSASERALSCSDYITKRGVMEGAVEVMKLVHSARRLLQ